MLARAIYSYKTTSMTRPPKLVKIGIRSIRRNKIGFKKLPKISYVIGTSVSLNIPVALLNLD